MRKNFRLTAAQTDDMRRALLLIGDRKLLVADLVRVALGVHGERLEAKPTPVDYAAEEFLRAILRRGRRDATYRFYSERLAPFVEASQSKTLDDWNRAGLKGFLERMGNSTVDRAGNSPTTIEMTFRAVRALYNWAAQQNPPMVNANPVDGLALDLPDTPRNIKFFTVEQSSGLLKNMGDLTDAVALQLFGGIRPEEIAPRSSAKARLEWKHVLIREKIIRVPAEVAKTGNARIIEGLPPALWRWLGTNTDREGPVCKASAGTLVRKMRPHVGGTWIQDGLRHTFATYAMAEVGNAGTVANWLGHEGGLTTFHNSYRGLTTKTIAGRFWALRR